MSRAWTAALLAAAFVCACAEEPKPLDTRRPPRVPVARIVALTGDVQVKARGTNDWLKATEGLTLAPRDQVKAIVGAGAKIEFSDGTVLEVRADSLVTIEGIADLRLDSGSGIMKSRQKNLVKPPEVSTGSSDWTDSRATREPPAVAVEAEETGEGRFHQLRGMGRVTTKAGEVVDLDPNSSVDVDARGRAGPKRELPPAPRLLSPPHGAELAYPDPRRAVTVLAWQAVPRAIAYHIQVDDDGWFTPPMIRDDRVRGSSLTLNGLAPGRYSWRVAALDARASEGGFSEPARFGIRSGGAPPPALVVEPLVVRRNVLRIAGRAEAGAIVTVNGQRVDVQKDGTFAEFVTLPGVGEQKVKIRVRWANGATQEQEQTVRVAPD
jgi:hypothetical protein